MRLGVRIVQAGERSEACPCTERINAVIEDGGDFDNGRAYAIENRVGKSVYWSSSKRTVLDLVGFGELSYAT
jgi:hypothetical protein